MQFYLRRSEEPGIIARIRHGISTFLSWEDIDVDCLTWQCMPKPEQCRVILRAVNISWDELRCIDYAGAAKAALSGKAIGRLIAVQGAPADWYIVTKKGDKMNKTDGLIVNTGFSNDFNRSVFISWKELGLSRDEWRELSYQQKKEALEDALSFFCCWYQVKFLTFQEALEAAKNGDIITRRAWNNKKFIAYKDEPVMFYDIADDAKKYSFTNKDMTASDWYEVQE